MKKNRFIALLSIVCSSAILVSGISAIAAWFSGSNFNINGKNGYTASNYYARGTGTEDDPFIINHPIHMYNFAWLQYLGEYNKETSNPGEIEQQYYWEVENDLDMTGYVLPPIGTTKNPFLGNFDGNNHIISNVTTSNIIASGEIEKTPLSVTTLENANIVGLFGVVGECYETDEEGTPIYGLHLVYDSSINQINNLKLENADVHTKTDSSLIGIAAGYVNGTVNNVSVVDSDINVQTGTRALDSRISSNISEYTTVGYATKDHIAKVNNGRTDISNIDTSNFRFVHQGSGEDQGWGGSIDMLSMYGYLRSKYHDFSATGGTGKIAPVQYPTRKTITYNEDGEIISEVDSGLRYNGVASGAVPADFRESRVGTAAYYFSFEDKNANDEVTSSYTYIQEMTGTSDKQYMCLSGYAERSFAETMTLVENGYIDDTGFTISYQGNYLNWDGGTGITNGTSYDSATVWFYDESQNIIYTVIEGTSTRRYLYGSGTSLSVVNDDNETYWEILNDNTITNGVSSIIYQNYTWKMSTTSDRYYVSMQRNGTTYYLTTSSTGTTARTTAWSVNSSGNLYTTSGSNTYYVGLNNLGTSGTINVGTNVNYKFSYLNGQLYYYNGTRYYYLSSLGTLNRFQYARSNKVPTAAITFTPVADATSVTFTDKDIFVIGERTSTGEDSPWITKDTYFPLSHENGVPKDKNTGYVVAGANYKTDRWGDIRVSKFATDSLSRSGGAALTSVRTINASGDQVINTTTANSFAKYNESLPKMKDILNKSINTGERFDGPTSALETGIFGMHFMNATIKTIDDFGHDTRIEKAVINGTEHSNYQVPMDCIDFNLKDKGYINFFAGTYYTNNDSFFSLYDVFRFKDDPTTIDEIREITGVYRSSVDLSHSYVYEYTDEYSRKTYSVPFKFISEEGERIKVKLDGTPYDPYNRVVTTKASGYDTKVFDTAWIKKNSTVKNNSNYAYYFEIPMNDGEYCLGSVSNGTGAYLMYLDIGANAEQVERTSFVQTKVFTLLTTVYPKGINVHESINDEFVEADTVAVKVKEGSSGEMMLSRRDDNYTLTGNNSTLDTVFVNPGGSVEDGSGNDIPMSYYHSEETITKTITDVDYNHAIAAAIITTIEETTSIVDGVVTTIRTARIENPDGTPAADQNIYDNHGYIVTKDDIVIDITRCDSIVYVLSYSCENDVNIDMNVTYTVLGGDYVFYEFTGNELMITVEEDTSIDVVLKDASHYDLYINGQFVASSGTIVVNP